MPKVIFRYNLKGDVWNWVRILRHPKHWGTEANTSFCPVDLQKKITKLGQEKAEQAVSDYLKPRIEKDLGKEINQYIKIYSALWNKINNKFFARLKKITQKPICAKEFVADITTASRCPYFEGHHSFMVKIIKTPKYQRHVIDIATHEILHLQFLHYYRQLCEKNKLSEAQIQHLKESLTFLLNTDFSDIITDKDLGYPDHQKLRKGLEKIWLDSKKDFSLFLPEAIKLTKKLF